MLVLGVLPFAISSLILSNIKTFASTAIPTVRTIPAIPESVSVAWNIDSKDMIMSIFANKATTATTPNVL